MDTIIRSSRYAAILVMQMKVNDVIMSFVQLRLNLLLRQFSIRQNDINLFKFCIDKVICGHLGYANEGQ